MATQEDFNKLVNEINIYKQQVELIQNQIDLIRTSMAEVEALSNTLDDLKGKDSIEAFVPVGAGSFMRAELKNTDDIIISIGAGVAVKKDVEGTKEIIAAQKEDLADSLDKMLAQLQQTTDIVGQLSMQAEQMMAQGQAPRM
ncbi:MAG: prefoldin subunit alpha [archaeon]|nr:prefoldin subunit alpha [archaeon]